MRVAREIRFGSPDRVSPFAHERLGAYKPLPMPTQELPYYLRFRVEDKAGIIATLATILAKHNIGIDAVLQLPREDWRDLPFVVTTEPAREQSIREAIWRFATPTSWSSRPLPCPCSAAFNAGLPGDARTRSLCYDLQD